jgi:hypothetical protein
MTTPTVTPLGGADAGMPAWFRAWNRFWFKPIDPTGLGFMRILCGLLVLYVHLVYSYDFYSYVGPNSWLDVPTQNYLRHETLIEHVPTSWTDQQQFVDPNEARGEYLWSIYFHVQDPAWLVVIHVGILAVMLLFTLGLWTRVTSVLAWMGAMQYVQRLPTSMFGMDTMMMILLMYLMVGNSGAALSLDRWLELRRERREKGGKADLALKPSWPANFAIRLIQLHFCIIYFVSGTSKLLGASWWNGTALWLCLANYNFAPMRAAPYNEFLIFLCQHRPLWELFMTQGVIFTLFTEIGFTFLVWNPRWRPVLVTCSVLMHLGIGLIMGLVVFSLFMHVMVLAFVPPDQIRIFLEQTAQSLRRRFRAKASPPPLPAPAKEPLVLNRT